MNKYLFYNFLDNESVYNACTDYWKIKIGDLLVRNRIYEAKPYLNTTFGDGTSFFNGNPIINYYFPDLGKAFRIIQEEPNPNDLEVSAWIDKFETEDIDAKELVISIQLTPNTEKVCFQLISKWIIDNYSTKSMEKFIELKLEMEKIEPYNEIMEKIFA